MALGDLNYMKRCISEPTNDKKRVCSVKRECDLKDVNDAENAPAVIQPENDLPTSFKDEKNLDLDGNYMVEKNKNDDLPSKSIYENTTQNIESPQSTIPDISTSAKIAKIIPKDSGNIAISATPNPANMKQTADKKDPGHGNETSSTSAPHKEAKGLQDSSEEKGDTSQIMMQAQGFSSFAASGFASKFAGFGQKQDSSGNTLNTFAKKRFNEKANPWVEEGHEKLDDPKKIDSPGGETLSDKSVTVELKKQAVPTGEEDEETVYVTRTTLYAMNLETEESWRERGAGSLRVNVRDNKKARLVMRSDGLLRVTLNLPLVQNMKLERGMLGSRAGEKVVRLTGFENNKPVQFAFKCANSESADKLYSEIKHVLPPPESI